MSEETTGTDAPEIDVQALQASLSEANSQLETANNRVKRLKNEMTSLDSMLDDLRVITDCMSQIPHSNPEVGPRFTSIANGLRELRQRVGHV